ncbi:MAG: DUF5005 domain-containing protein [Bacteroidetes bacterium]|nr:DUF5005 domain-containing protein [Bacteroidota bacterium]
MRRMLIVILVSTAAFACEGPTYPLSNRCGAPGISVYADPTYDFLFKGPISSGEINSVVEWNAKKIWLMSNVKLNTANGEKSFKNYVVVSDGNDVDIKYTLPDPDDTHFYTINQGIASDEKIELIVSLWRDTGKGRGGAVHEADFIYVLSTDEWKATRVRVIDAPVDVVFGSALMLDESYYYIYATRNAFWNKDALIARVSGSFLNAWEFYDGYNWVSNADTMRPVISGVTDFFSVFKEGDSYYAVSYGALFSQEIQLLRAYLPYEGWAVKKILYCSSPVDHVIDANGIVLDHSGSTLNCSYNRIDQSLENFSNNSPGFIDINNWNY